MVFKEHVQYYIGRFDVILLDRTTRSIFIFLAVFFTAGVRWPLNASRTSILLFLNSTPGLLIWMMFSQSFIKSVDILPWFWHLTIFLLGRYSFGIALCFHTTYVSNIMPSVNTANITVSCIFSSTKASLVVDFVPIFSMLQRMAG